MGSKELQESKLTSPLRYDRQNKDQLKSQLPQSRISGPAASQNVLHNYVQPFVIIGKTINPANTIFDCDNFYSGCNWLRNFNGTISLTSDLHLGNEMEYDCN